MKGRRTMTAAAAANAPVGASAARRRTTTVVASSARCVLLLALLTIAAGTASSARAVPETTTTRVRGGRRSRPQQQPPKRRNLDLSTGDVEGHEMTVHNDDGGGGDIVVVPVAAQGGGNATTTQGDGNVSTNQDDGAVTTTTGGGAVTTTASGKTGKSKRGKSYMPTMSPAPTTVGGKSGKLGKSGKSLKYRCYEDTVAPSSTPMPSSSKSKAGKSGKAIVWVDCTQDADSDGVPDDVDADPNDPTVTTVFIDQDSDGVNDGDATGGGEDTTDADSDGIDNESDPDTSDPDANSNGIIDGLEDSDSDGITDGSDSDPSNPDANSNGVVDGNDPAYQDSDSDGIADDADAEPSDPDANSNGIVDGIEDSDSDGIANESDEDPSDPDANSNGIVDGIEDSDSDGITNDVDVDASDADTNSNGIVDGIEDSDSDGIANDSDSDPSNPDANSDGVVDGDEDSDSDGIFDVSDADPSNADSNSNGIIDGIEDSDSDGITNDSDADPSDPDSNSNGIVDGNEDSDSDGIANDSDSDPSNPDANSDGTVDGEEDSDSDGIPDVSDADPSNADSNSNGIVDGDEDSDSDGITNDLDADPSDPDSNSNGIVDGNEDSDSDGIANDSDADPSNADANSDGVVDGDEDSDSDGIADVSDKDPSNADSNSNGIVDGIEDSDSDGIIDGSDADPSNADANSNGVVDGIDPDYQDSGASDIDTTPQAYDDYAVTGENSPIDIPVLANDVDEDGDALQVILVNSPANGIATHANDMITYTPPPGFLGSDSFEYTIRDEDDNEATATVYVTVTNTPQAINDEGTTPQGIPFAFEVLANDFDPNGDEIELIQASQPSFGTTTMYANMGIVLYAPSSDFVGTDVFTYTIQDTDGNQATAYVTVLVTAALTATRDSAVTAENTPVNVDVLANDSGEDIKIVSVEYTSDPPKGLPQVNSDGTIKYTPGPGYLGEDEFFYTVMDSNSATAEAKVSILVTNTPIAENDQVTVASGTPITIDVLSNDFDPNGDALTVDMETEPSNGQAVVNPDGSITYEPSEGFVGTDSLTYSVEDPDGNADTATVTIIVSDSPIAANDMAVTGEAMPVVIDVLANDSDPNGDALTLTHISTPIHGVTESNSDQTITYVPPPLFLGVDTFFYTVTDSDGNRGSAAVIVTVTNTPTAVDDESTTVVNVPIDIDVLANDVDPNGDNITVTSVDSPGFGQTLVNSDGTIEYSPTNSFIGTDQFTYTIDDGNGNTATAKVVVEVTPPPIGEDETNEDGIVVPAFSPGCDAVANNEVYETDLTADLVFNYELALVEDADRDAANDELQELVRQFVARELVYCPTDSRRMSTREARKTSVVGVQVVPPHGRRLQVDGVGAGKNETLLDQTCTEFTDSAEFGVESFDCYAMQAHMLLYLREDSVESSELESSTQALGTVREAFNNSTRFEDGVDEILGVHFIGGFVDEGEGVSTGDTGGTGTGVGTGSEVSGANQERSTNDDDDAISGLGTFFIVAACLGVLLIALLALRRRRSTREVITEELIDDEMTLFGKDGYKSDDKNIPIEPADTELMSMSSQSPSNLSSPGGWRKSRGAHVVGEDDSVFTSRTGGDTGSIIDDLQASEKSPYGYGMSSGRARGDASFVNPDEDDLGSPHSGINVHQCTSATCEICTDRRKNDPTFVSTDLDSPASVMGMSYASRTYPTEDTVDF